jgi:hypothetical protein
MFTEPTVFVLGAGASWHYGYPTGEDLTPKVIEKAENLAKFFTRGWDESSPHIPAYARRNYQPSEPPKAEMWTEAAREASALAARLKIVNPPVIDYFLADNPDLHDIGRLAIAMVIFDCERHYHASHGKSLSDLAVIGACMVDLRPKEKGRSFRPGLFISVMLRTLRQRQ